MRSPLPVIVIVASLVLGSQVASLGDSLRFNRDIRPILSDNCFACHGPIAKEAKAGLQLHTRETATALLGKAQDRRAIVPGDRTKSELWARINAGDPDERMPPPESNHELSASEIDTLGRWIDEGAEFEGHWAFQPVGASTDGSIDELIRAGLADAGLEPSPPADKRTLLRRLTQDLTGLPPTPEEIAGFIGNHSPDAYEREVDRLLESPAAAERLAVDWLDGARYADTNGYSIDDHRDMWVWRDWVIHAFLTNKPFDEFTVEQIAGDLLPDAGEQHKVATGFLRNSMNTHEGGTIPEEYRVTYTADKVDTVATVFMGLTVKCAQCHDHKYDPITQREYYEFFAFFNTSSEPGGGAVNANTAPLIEAGSPICPPERVKRDIGYRLAELQQMRATPEPALARLRDEWERETLDRLAPVHAETKPTATPDLPLLPDDPPSWIWAADDTTAATAEFRREFELAATPTVARLFVSCDDACTIRVNGSEIGTTELWMDPKVFPVANLKAGLNRIEIDASNEVPSPAGLLLSIAMQSPDGEVIHVATSTHWQARTPAEGQERQWKPAATVGKHGDKPWGDVVARLNGDKKNDDGALYLALSTPRTERSASHWRTINDAFAGKVEPLQDLPQPARPRGKGPAQGGGHRPFDGYGDELQAAQDPHSGARRLQPARTRGAAWRTGDSPADGQPRRG